MTKLIVATFVGVLIAIQFAFSQQFNSAELESAENVALLDAPQSDDSRLASPDLPQIDAKPAPKPASDDGQLDDFDFDLAENTTDRPADSAPTPLPQPGRPSNYRPANPPLPQLSTTERPADSEPPPLAQPGQPSVHPPAQPPGIRGPRSTQPRVPGPRNEAPRGVPQRNTSAQNEPRETRILALQLKYASVDAIQAVMMQLGIKSHFAIDQRTNTIVLHATDEDIDKVKSIVELLDVPAPRKQEATSERQSVERRLLEQMLALEEQSKRYGEQHPDIVATKARIDLLQDSVKASRNTDDPTSQYLNEPSPTSEFLAQLRFKYQFAEAEISELSSELGTIDNVAQRERTARQLKERILESFELRQALQSHRVEQARRKLDEVEKRIQRRREQSKRIVEQRFRQLAEKSTRANEDRPIR